MLVVALAAAMVVGGFGGVLLSGRLRVAEPAAMSFAEVAERNSGAVVLIRTQFELVDETGEVTLRDARSGSGFIISSTGLVVTNRHLVREWEYAETPAGASGRTTSIEVIMPGEKIERAVPAKVYRLSENAETDVAILKIEPLPSIATVYGFEPDLSRINQGDEVAVIGYPLGIELIHTTRDELIDNSLCAGIVSRVGQNDIQLSLRVYHGNSGGPVLNRKGEVIGILTATLANAQDLAVSTPIAKALDLIRGDPGYRQDQDQ